MSNMVVFLARPRVLFFSTEMERVMGGGFERDFARNKMGMSRSFGEPLGRGMGKKASRGRGHPRGRRLMLRSEVLFRQSQLFFHSLKKIECFLDLGKKFWSLNFFTGINSTVFL